MKDLIIKKRLFKLFSIEDLQQVSYLDGSLLFHFSNSNIGFIALNKNCTNAYLSKKAKTYQRKGKLIKNKFNSTKSVDFIKRTDK